MEKNIETIDTSKYIGKIYTDKNIIVKVINIKLVDNVYIAELFMINRNEKKICGCVNWSIDELEKLIECNDYLLLAFLNEIIRISGDFKVSKNEIKTRDPLTNDELKCLQKHMFQTILSFAEIQEINNAIKNDIIYINELSELTHIHFMEFFNEDCSYLFFTELRIIGINENGISKLF